MPIRKTPILFALIIISLVAYSAYIKLAKVPVDNSAAILESVQSAQKINPANGRSTEFKDTAGPMAFMEWRAADQFNFGLRFASLNYESTRGASYSGNQGGLYLGMWF